MAKYANCRGRDPVRRSFVLGMLLARLAADGQVDASMGAALLSALARQNRPQFAR